MKRDEFSDNVQDLIDALDYLVDVAATHYWPDCARDLRQARLILGAAQDSANNYGEEP